MSDAEQNAIPEATPARPWWLGPVRFVFQILRVLIAVATALGTKAAIAQGGPMAGLVVLAGLLLLVLLTWLLSKGLNLLAADSARPTPSRGLAIFKLIVGLPLAYVALFGLNPEWSVGLLPAGGKQPLYLYALGFAAALALGIHLVLMGAFALAGSRPSVWLRAAIALFIIGAGVGLGPTISGQYLAFERARGKYPLYTSDYEDFVHLGFAPNNEGLYLVDKYGEVKLWKFDEDDPETILGGDVGSNLWSATFSRRGSHLAWRRSSKYGVVNLATGENTARLDGLADCLALTDDGGTLACGRSDIDPKIELIDVASGKFVRGLALEGVKKPIALAFHPDSKWLYSGSEDGTLAVFDAEGGKPRELAKLPGKIFCLATSPDGKLLAATGSGIGVTVIDADSGEIVTRFLGHNDDSMSGPSFGSDSRIILSSGGISSGKALVWEARTGRILYERPLSDFFGSALSPNDQRVATSVNDHAKVWDISKFVPAGK